MQELDSVRVVLVEPRHPGNIGATARVMANMGVSALVLVNPLEFPSPVATARAAGAGSILERARVVDSLDAAIAECSLVIGATARRRSVHLPTRRPEQAMRELVAAEHPASAILFGNEQSGLTNEALQRCHALTRVPVEETFSSLNLGVAVAVLLYELRRQTLQSGPPGDGKPQETPATAHELRKFQTHLQRLITRSGFDDGSSVVLQRKMARLFQRVRMRPDEVRMMRGLFASIEGRFVDSDTR